MPHADPPATTDHIDLHPPAAGRHRHGHTDSDPAATPLTRPPAAAAHGSDTDPPARLRAEGWPSAGPDATIPDPAAVTAAVRDLQAALDQPGRKPSLLLPQAAALGRLRSALAQIADVYLACDPLPAARRLDLIADRIRAAVACTTALDILRNTPTTTPRPHAAHRPARRTRPGEQS
jgi:hypothetical protein